jgi:Na+-driven multidrug efflux pump
VQIFNDKPELVEACVHAAHIYFFGLFLMALQCAGQSTFVALGKAKKAVFFSIFRKIVIVVPLTLLLPRFMGIDGVFWAEPISNLIGGVACYVTMLATVLPELKRLEREKM